MMDFVIVSLRDRPDTAAGARKLLHEQWPRNWDHVAPDNWDHIVAVAPDGAVVAHGSLHPSAESADGVSAIVQNLVVAPTHRRAGVGRAVLRQLEAIADERGFGYVSLLAAVDAVGFYLRAGYVRAPPASLASHAVLALEPRAVGLLEAALGARLARGPVRDAAQLDSPSAPQSARTWLRRRLRAFSAAERDDCATAAALHAVVVDAVGRVTGSASATHVIGWAAPLRWRRQIGPSCGLTALVMACSTLARRPVTARGAAVSCGGCGRGGGVGEGIDAEAGGGGLCSSADVEASVSPWVEQLSCGACGGGGACALPTVAQSAAAGALARSPDAAVFATGDIPHGGGAPCCCRAVPGALAAHPAPLLDYVVARGWSSDGEMWSARRLAAAARDVCGLDAAVLPMPRADGAPSDPGDSAADGPPWSSPSSAAATDVCDLVAGVVAGGGVVLVAYDADASRGHAPADLRGESAHWAAVVGVAEAAAPGRATESLPTPPLRSRRLFMLLQHSASARPVAADADALLRSSAQLGAAGAPSRKARGANWVVAGCDVDDDDDGAHDGIRCGGGGPGAALTSRLVVLRLRR